LSTALSTASLSPSWKQEVNRRVAAHLSHKSQTAIEPGPSREGRVAASPAAQAARRVAARFASAPSYSEMLAREALAAARAAEAASKAAQEAHAAAQSVLSAVSLADPDWDSQADAGQVSDSRTAATTMPAPRDSFGPSLVEAESLFVDHPAPEQPAEPPRSAPARSKSRKRRQNSNAAPDHGQREPLWASLAAATVEDASSAGIAEPIFANLIQFPREVIATRKMRPRRAEGPLAAFSSAGQLSIFEVDPETVSTQPSNSAADGPATPDWMRTEWSNLEPNEPPQQDLLEKEEPATQIAQSAALKLVSLNRRLMALVVDGSLTLAAFVGATALAVHYAKAPMSPRPLEIVAAVALLAIAAAYQTLFFTLGIGTPGMMYAGVGLRTLEGQTPTRRQRCARLMALPLSVLPLGLGLIWALFDETHLTWHDRLSGTYLRKR
jgi:uncharacterized RDD family membrane protein YckC